MPEHLRALITILLLSFIVFAIAQKPACQIIEYEDFKRRRNLWYGITLTAFLAHNFWVYLFVAGGMLFIFSKQEERPVALFFMLIFALPTASIQVPGFGLVNYLIDFNHQRLLTLIIFFPAFLALQNSKDTMPFGRLLSEKFFGAYLLLLAILSFREPSITNALRNIFDLVTFIILPYYVISRSLRNLADFRNALLAFVLAVMVLALIGVFEATQHWLLYSSLIEVFDMDRSMTRYLSRAGALRAIATSGQSIVLGYLMAVAIGLYLFLQQPITSKLYRRLGLLLLIAGLLAALSRGPWVGAVFIIVLFVATGRHAARILIQLALVGAILIPLVGFLPGGEKIVNLLPFIGETEQGTISYRESLIDNSLIVIKRHPFFGSEDYLEAPEMESMRQGNGIIDIVNSYVRVALDTGLVGLALFVGLFLSISCGIFRSFRSISDKSSGEHLLGRALFATIMGIMLIISTVSSIKFIPLVYWSVAGLGVAYINMVKRSQMENKISSFSPKR